MKKRILAQILILCTVFSALHMTAWATPDVIPYPYIEDVCDNGEIPADKFLTIIATSNDLNITSIALRAINADSGKEVIPATSDLLHSRFSDGCYEYKQDFILSGDLKTSGGKWLFEVTSTYEPIRGGSEVKSSIRKLPNDYEKAHWYSYYTIVKARRKILCKRFSTKSRLACGKRSSLLARSLANPVPSASGTVCAPPAA